MAEVEEKERAVVAESIWAGLLETIGAADIAEYVQQWEAKADQVVMPLKEAEQLAAQDFQIRINAR